MGRSPPRPPLLLLLGVASSLVATTATGKTVSDSYVTVRPYIVSSNVEVDAGPTTRATAEAGGGAKPQTVNYSTNAVADGGVGVSYRGLGISYGKPQPQTPAQIKTRGKTDGDNYDLTYTADHIKLDAYYKRLVGFYINNPQATDPTWTGGNPYPQLPKMAVTTAGVSATAVWSPKAFSLPALFDQSEIQTKSGGSFLGSVNADTTRIKSPQALVLPSQAALYKSDASLEGIEISSAGLQGGYGYTLVSKKGFYLGASLLLGFNEHVVRREGQKSASKPSGAAAEDFLLGAGYNTVRFFLGVDYVAKTYEVDLDYTRLTVSRTNLELFIGTRF